MKRYSTKSWAAAVVLAITAADCVGIYVAQVRLHREVPITAPEMAYADATAVKDTWRGTGVSPEAERAYASTVSTTPAADAQTMPAPVTPNVVPAPQRLAQADIKVPAFKPKTDAFLAAPRLAEAAPAERVELATEVHAVQHRVALRRAALNRAAQQDTTPRTSMSFAAAFGGGNAPTAALALPEPSFGKQAESGTVVADLAKSPTTSTDAPRADVIDMATIGKSPQSSSDASDPELPAVSAVVQSAALPGN